MISPEGRVGRNLLIAGSALACAAAFMFPIAGKGNARSKELGNQCQPYIHGKNSEFQACIAYTVDAVGYIEVGREYGGLTPFLGFGKSPNKKLADHVRRGLEDDYYLSAREEMIQRVEEFPAGEYFAENSVRVLSIVANAAQRRAIVSTVESWQVGLSSDELVYEEESQIHSSTLCALDRGEFTHMVVVANTAKPDFSCNDFAAQVKAGKIK